MMADVVLAVSTVYLLATVALVVWILSGALAIATIRRRTRAYRAREADKGYHLEPTIGCVVTFQATWFGLLCAGTMSGLASIKLYQQDTFIPYELSAALQSEPTDPALISSIVIVLAVMVVLYGLTIACVWKLVRGRITFDAYEAGDLPEQTPPSPQKPALRVVK